MRWRHRCSLEWLKARQLFLTATDVKELLPVTKTGRPRNVPDESFMRVYARKVESLCEEDCYSEGAAARGHVLEPYAIERFNNEFGMRLYHWDDTIVTKSLVAKQNELAFSPDACNVPMLEGATVCHSDPTVIAEVKCYGAERHLLKGCTPKEDLEERWQVATAMAVCDSIETAFVVFYNPSLENSMFVAEYLRSDLEDEIAMIYDVEKKWQLFVSGIGAKFCNKTVYGNPTDEMMIVEEIAKREEFNPDNFKTVIL